MTDLFNCDAHHSSEYRDPDARWQDVRGKQAHVLIVDDDVLSLTLAQMMLEPHFRVTLADSATAAEKQVKGFDAPDLILLDLLMPEIDGCRFIQRHKATLRLRNIPVILLTGTEDLDVEAEALANGAADFVRKPCHAPALLARVSAQLELRQQKRLLKHRNAELSDALSRQTRQNVNLQHLSLRAIARLAEARDLDTGRHMRRTQALVYHLSQLVRQHTSMGAQLTAQWVSDMTASAPLHDIGKVGLPDQVLLKPGRLTPEERVLMQQHTTIGANAIARAESETEHRFEFLRMAKDMARHHHESWDGTGYPDRLAGDAIPLAARIMAVADVFDALVSPRVYKAAMDYGQAFKIMSDGRATQFDPLVLDVFLGNYIDFCQIASRTLSDSDVNIFQSGGHQ